MTKKRASKNLVRIDGNVEESPVVAGDNNVINVIRTIIHKTEPRKLILYSLGIVLGISSIVAGVWNYFLKYDTSYMGGQLNIVVEPFLEERSGRLWQSEQGLILAQYFYSELNDEIAGGQFESDTRIKAGLRGPQAAPPLRYAYWTGPDIAAQRVASRINAHIVIYGVITRDEFDRPYISIRFYVSPDQFSDAQEILGENELGNPILLTGNLRSGADLEGENEELRNRVQVVSLLMKAIGSYVGEDFPGSLQYLEAALSDDLWKQTTGREVVYLLAGNVLSRQALPVLLEQGGSPGIETIQRAEEYYNQALLSAEPKGDYARAYIGLAGIQNYYAIHKARLSADYGDVDLTALEKEEVFLDKALAATYKPVSADIEEKVAFNRAQVFLLRHQLSNDPAYLANAEGNYRLVIESYESGKSGVRELAAHSHAGLALIARIQGKTEDALREYEKAFKTTRIPSLQGMYLYHIGNVHYESADYGNALKYYTSALEMRADLEKRISEEQLKIIQERMNEIEEKLGNGATQK